jgi:beta-xylosidase
VLRLVSLAAPAPDINLWNVPNVLLQKFPGPAFTVTTKLRFTPRSAGDQTGLAILGKSYSALVIENTAQGLRISQSTRLRADQGGVSQQSQQAALSGDTFYLRATVDSTATVRFSYSQDGAEFHEMGSAFQATTGAWIGAKVGIFAVGTATHGELGYADYDWIHFDR